MAQIDQDAINIDHNKIDGNATYALFNNGTKGQNNNFTNLPSFELITSTNPSSLLSTIPSFVGNNISVVSFENFLVPDGAFATNIKPGDILYEGNSYNTLVVKTFPIKVNEF